MVTLFLGPSYIACPREGFATVEGFKRGQIKAGPEVSSLLRILVSKFVVHEIPVSAHRPETLHSVPISEWGKGRSYLRSCTQVRLRRCVAHTPKESARRVDLADMVVTILIASATVLYLSLIHISEPTRPY